MSLTEEQESKRKDVAKMQAELTEVRQKLQDAEQGTEQTADPDKPASTAESKAHLHALRDRRRLLSSKLNQTRDQVGASTAPLESKCAFLSLSG